MIKLTSHTSPMVVPPSEADSVEAVLLVALEGLVGVTGEGISSRPEPSRVVESLEHQQVIRVTDMQQVLLQRREGGR